MEEKEIIRRLYPYLVDEEEAQEMYNLLRHHLFTPTQHIGEEEILVMEDYCGNDGNDLYGRSVNWEELR